MFSNLENFLLICGIFRFLFFENFYQLIFQGIKTIYLISSTFLGILWVQYTNLVMLFKVINENSLLLLESGFFWLLKPKWYLHIKLVAFQQFPSNGNCQQCVFSNLESFLLISSISGFLFFLPQSIFENPETTEYFVSSFFVVLRIFI